MKIKFSIIICLFVSVVHGQNDRLQDRNNINWVQLYSTGPLNNKFQWLVEYQWRRTEGLKNWQQSLLRIAIQFQLNPQVSFAIGYGWIETFTYGDFPLAANGTFPEHRLHEQVQLKVPINNVLITQRLRVEQRWIGARTASANRQIEQWIFSHRFRYLARVQVPITPSKKIYVAASDEIFISAGKNVQANTFDQNRLSTILGVKINPVINIEAGYLNQTLLQGKRMMNKTILQNNNGFVVAFIFNL